MRLRILGADGGIAKDCRTNCFLFNKEILIDASTGLAGAGTQHLSGNPHVFNTLMKPATKVERCAN